MKIGLILKVIRLKLFLDHNRLHKPQDSLEIANPVTRILFTWTAQAALSSVFLREIIYSTHVVISTVDLDITSKNNMRQEFIKVRH